MTDRAFWQTFEAAGATSFAGVPHTFESLHQSRFPLRELKTLRYATQAGGRLDPSLVSHFGRLAAAHGWRFVVMYGQTEAGPRIAYLPPEHAVAHANCIGVPVPGGRIVLLDEEGRGVTAVDTPGQLAYSGPNVMMGYAERAADLATDETPGQLLTGDLACRNAQGFFHITGRVSRFVKPFGVRVNLDDLESALQPALPGARCAGDDGRIVVAVAECFKNAGAPAVSNLARAVNLPEFVFRFVVTPEIPRLPTGKVDYASILAAGASGGVREEPPRLDVPAAMRLVFSARFVRQVAIEFTDMLGVCGREWRGVGQIYETLLSTEGVQESDTFKTLAGDSLSYVQVAAALTDYLGALPADWPDRSVRELELARPVNHGSIV